MKNCINFFVRFVQLERAIRVNYKYVTAARVLYINRDVRLLDNQSVRTERTITIYNLILILCTLQDADSYKVLVVVLCT